MNYYMEKTFNMKLGIIALIVAILFVSFTIYFEEEINVLGEAVSSKIKPIVGFCSDLDSNLELSGSCSSTKGTTEDYCKSSTVLMEASCKDSKTCDYMEIDCLNHGYKECTNGACKNDTEQIICSDPDISITTKGTCISSNTFSESVLDDVELETITLEDYCKSTNLLMESVCSDAQNCEYIEIDCSSQGYNGCYGGVCTNDIEPEFDVYNLSREEFTRILGTIPEDLDELIASGTKVMDFSEQTPLLEYPQVFNLLDYMTPVKNQGLCGSCWAFSAIAAIESELKMKTGLTLDLSEQELVSCCPTQTSGCLGGHPIKALMYIKNNSISLEDCFAYQFSDAPCTFCSNKIPNNSMGVEDLAIVNKTDFKLAIIMNHTVIITIASVPISFQNYKYGIYSDVEGEEIIPNGHAMLLVGYNDIDEYWIVKNSWGENWGENGYVRIAYETMSKYVEPHGFIVLNPGKPFLAYCSNTTECSSYFECISGRCSLICPISLYATITPENNTKFDWSRCGNASFYRLQNRSPGGHWIWLADSENYSSEIIIPDATTSEYRVIAAYGTSQELDENENAITLNESNIVLTNTTQCTDKCGCFCELNPGHCGSVDIYSSVKYVNDCTEIGCSSTCAEFHGLDAPTCGGIFFESRCVGLSGAYANSPSCTEEYFCNGTNRCYKNANCAVTDCIPCTYGCNNGTCNPPTCSPGYVCNGTYKCYQNADCTLTSCTNCSEGCTNGVCNLATCTDSDGGLVYTKYGFCSGKYSTSEIDYCYNKDYVYEAYCKQDGTCGLSSPMPCTSVTGNPKANCYLGACVTCGIYGEACSLTSDCCSPYTCTNKICSN